MMKIDIDALLNGNRRMLAKAITLVESQADKHVDAAQELLEKILPHSGKSIRIGITGVPGAGKSTLIEALGLYLVELGKKVAVLAIDPSSPISGGSILGDKTRMEKLASKKNAFIRPSPTKGAVGGIANKTREALLLCEANGYDVIIIETLGVGQSEFEVSEMADIFLMLMLPNAGDELQGIKKGILELANVIAVNKADGDNYNQAQLAKSQFESAVHLLYYPNNVKPVILTCSALEHSNINELWDSIESFIENEKKEKRFNKKRAEQNYMWMEKIFYQLIDHSIKSNPQTLEQSKKLEELVINNEVSPFNAAKQLFESLLFNKD